MTRGPFGETWTVSGSAMTPVAMPRTSVEAAKALRNMMLSCERDPLIGKHAKPDFVPPVKQLAASRWRREQMVSRSLPWCAERRCSLRSDAALILLNKIFLKQKMRISTITNWAY
jgi:hypothetical protein